MQTAQPEAQQPLIDTGSTDDRSRVEPPSIDPRTRIRIVDDRSTDHHIRCVLALDDPNPRGRLKCKVDYAVIASWPQKMHAAALSVAAHWFRDIGGFQTLRAAPLKHIIQRLQETGADGKPLYTEHMFHIAINAYANQDREWRIKHNYAWKSIGSFFAADSDLLDKYCPKTLNAPPAKPMTAQQRDRLVRQRAAQQQQLDKEHAARQAAMKRRRENAQKTADAPATIAECIERFIPERDRWCFYTPLSKTADTATKRRAKARAAELIPTLWRSLPDPIRCPIKSRVAAHCFKHGLDPEAMNRRNDPALRALQRDHILKALRSEHRQPKPIGHNLERSLR